MYKGSSNYVTLPYFTFWYLLSPKYIKFFLKIGDSYIIAAKLKAKFKLQNNMNYESVINFTL